MKTLIKQDSQILYHPEFDYYGIPQIFKIDENHNSSFSMVKEIIPHNVNIIQKIIIGFQQIKSSFNLLENKGPEN
jgi:hypothetical protein